MKLNIESILATDPEYSCWVNAGAGAGKTKILVDRVLRLLLHNVEFGKILCLTFTNAAANEMRERVLEAIRKWATLDKKRLHQNLSNLLHREPKNEEVNKASTLFRLYCANTDKIKIYTIHAFCQYILQTFAIEAELSPNFQIMSEIQRKNILHSIKIQTLNNIDTINTQTADSIRHFVDNTHDLKLYELFEKITQDQKKFINMFRKLESCELYEYYLRTELKTKDHDVLLNEFYSTVDSIGHISFTTKTPTDQKFVHTFNNFVTLNLDNKKQKFADIQGLFLTKNGTPRKTIISNEFIKLNPDTTRQIYALQSIVLELNNSFKAMQIIESSCHLFNIAKHTLYEYKAMCKAKNLLDYDDLIIHTKNLLTNSLMKDWILYKLDGGIEHILLDEAQDTSLDQWEIIDALMLDFFSGDSGKHKTIFVVGDEKQSIYSFQGAELNNFFYYKNKLRFLALSANQKFADIVLTKNYRSTKPILETVAHVFNRFREDYEGVFVDSNTNLECVRSSDSGLVACFSIDPVDCVEDELWCTRPVNNENTNKHALAKKIAEHISEILNSQILLPSTGKPISLGDIMVLVRKRDKFVNILNTELQRLNLHTSGFDKFLLKDNLAVLDLIALAKFILQPLDDLNLACLLKSPFFELDDETLHYIAASRKRTLWEEISSNILFQRYYTKLSEFRRIARGISLENFFHTFVDTIGYRENLSKINYESSYALNEFLNLAYNFSKEESNSLSDFIVWFGRNDVEVKRDIDSQDQISIMTIHGAKGLQSPIVILAEHANHKNITEMFLWNDDQVVLWNVSKQESDPYLLKVKDEYALGLTKESLRLFYVAITRSQDKFLFFGINQKNDTSEDDDSIKIKSWFQLFQKYLTELKSDKINTYNEFLRAQSEEKTIVEEISILKPLEKPHTKRVESKHNSPLEYNMAILYGQVAHKVLEDCVLKANAISNHPELLNLPANMRNKLQNDISAVLKIEKFKEMLEYKFHTEVDVAFKDESGEILTGRMDFISISELEVFIVDYKTDSNPDEDDVAKYISQLKFYYANMSNIYPNHTISCYILWISKHEFVRVI